VFNLGIGYVAVLPDPGDEFIEHRAMIGVLSGDGTNLQAPRRWSLPRRTTPRTRARARACAGVQQRYSHSRTSRPGRARFAMAGWLEPHGASSSPVPAT
jgi:hypothetical protein